MKKRTIWIISILMGFSFSALLYLQVKYFKEVFDIRQAQFDESVSRSLSQVAHNMELNETLQGIEKQIEVEASDSAKEVSEIKYKEEDKLNKGNSIDSLIPLKMDHQSIGKKMAFKTRYSISEALKNIRKINYKRFKYQEDLVNEVIYTIMYRQTTKSLQDRINFKLLDVDLRSELLNCGIDIPYHIRIQTLDGREIYRCSDYESEGEDNAYTQVLFPNDTPDNMALLKVHFPHMESYILRSVHFLFPAIFFTILLFIIFIFTIYTIFRQKRLTKMKNDFINNMTHELKTPISTISLAAQMLDDPVVSKSPSMLKHISSVIRDETKRLRFQVEKVLQMSMFDRNKATLNKRIVDGNKIIEDTVNIFQLKVESNNGCITSELNAKVSSIYVDEMHYTNVLFNLLDNAVKYKSPDRNIQLEVKSWNENNRFFISIKDNGIGIKKEDLKKIFEQFYRVQSSNLHDVKGFGLGLAYVKKVISIHDGEISATSEYGVGTEFIISLPIIKNKEL